MQGVFLKIYCCKLKIILHNEDFLCDNVQLLTIYESLSYRQGVNIIPSSTLDKVVSGKIPGEMAGNVLFHSRGANDEIYSSVSEGDGCLSVN